MTSGPLTPASRSTSAGVIAFSSGNHAQAVALAARILGVSATILMPNDAPVGRIEATRGYGARVILFDRYTDSREAMAREIAERTGAQILPPFDHADVIAGQGTAALELLEDVGELDMLIAPVGGGGLIISGGNIDLARFARLIASGE